MNVFSTDTAPPHPQALSSTYFLVAACKSVVGAGIIGDEVKVFTSFIVCAVDLSTIQALSIVEYSSAVSNQLTMIRFPASQTLEIGVSSSAK